MSKSFAARFLVIAALILTALSSALFLSVQRADWLLSFLRFTNYVPKTPFSAFGWFHLLCVFICVCAMVATCFAAARLPERKREVYTDRVVFGCGVAFALLEIYKQIYGYFILGSGIYDFSIFPFQFCSLPIYVCLLSPLLREGRLKHAAYCFLALFGTVGGYLVVGYPKLPPQLSLCIHTMLWHVLMIVLGGFLLVARRCGIRFREDYLSAAGLFLGSVALATLFNVLLEPLASASDTAINLFYLSPYQRTQFVLISDVQDAFGWFPSVLCYVFLFLLLGALPLWLLGRWLAIFLQKQTGK